MSEVRRDLRSEFGDEISLTDLAVTFVRRRRIFYIVFCVIAIAGLSFALLKDNSYQYVTLIQGATKASGDQLETPASMIANLEGQWLPDIRSEYQANHGKLPFKVSVENPENTQLIKIVSKAEEPTAGTVKAIHQALIAAVTKEQEARLELYKKRLKGQIAAVDQVISSLKADDTSGQALASAVDRKLTLETELNGLQPLSTLMVAQRSPDPVGPRRLLIAVLSVLVGVLAGIFSTFLMEFIATVRTRLSSS